MLTFTLWCRKKGRIERLFPPALLFLAATHSLQISIQYRKVFRQQSHFILPKIIYLHVKEEILVLQWIFLSLTGHTAQFVTLMGNDCQTTVEYPFSELLQPIWTPCWGSDFAHMELYKSRKKKINSSPTLHNLERDTRETEVQWNVSQHDKQFSVKQNREDSEQKVAKFHV